MNLNLANLAREFAAHLDVGLTLGQVRVALASELGLAAPAAAAELEQRIEFAQQLGLPLAESLREWADELDQHATAMRRLESAFAAPKATAKLITGLPLLSLVVAQLAGLDPIRSLVTKPLAGLAFAVGGLLLTMGWLLMKRMIHRARPVSDRPEEFLQLFAQSLLSGLPTGDCLAAVRVRLNLLARLPAPDSTIEAEVERLLSLSLSSGIALRGLLLSRSTAWQRERVAAQELAVERLAVRLMLPLGLVVLPAFALIGVVPVAVGMFGE